MANTAPVRIPVNTHAALNDLKRRAAAEAQRDITMGELITILGRLGESHFSEIVQIAKTR